MAALFSSDYKPQPYWWDFAKPEEPTDVPLPKDVDIAIVGSGYTGLQAAIQTARAGRSTLVIEAKALGFGASTRNGGQISTSVKLSHSKLSARYGPELATAILREGQASLDYIKDFVKTENLKCDFQVPGRFHGAHTPCHYDLLAKEAEATDSVIKTDAVMVPRSELHGALGTDAYHGGIVYPHHASLNSGLYHRELLRLARDAGAQIVSHCPVTAIEREAGGFIVSTPQGSVRANRVILATNGYTGPSSPWQRRRIIPIGSYIIATEELPADVMNRLMPTNRNLTDTRKLVVYYRPSPDRKRILFGGRVSLRETDPKVTGPKLHSEMVRIFPELANVKISHSWSGFVGYTFDTLMHAGNDDGLYYAMGYCGSGVGMASYLGMRIGQQAANVHANETAFSKIPFPTRPLYNGNPWFLAPSILLYRLRDRLGV